MQQEFGYNFNVVLDKKRVREKKSEVFRLIANNTKEIDFNVGLSKGKNQFSLEYDSLILNRGSYYINVTISGDHINTQYAATVNINKLEISSKSDLYGAGLVRLKPKLISLVQSLIPYT